MSLAEYYPWLKALHVASALVFVGGVFAAAVFLAAAAQEADISPSLVHAMRQWDRVVTTPAMLLVWMFGLTLASTGGWLGDGWLWAKLVLVVVLSGVHGVQSGSLRGLAGGGVLRRRSLIGVICGCIIGIAVLAVVKPF